MGAFIDLLHYNDIEVAVETQGTRSQPWLRKVNTVTISPKPPSSGMKHSWIALQKVIGDCNFPSVNLKVVVFDDQDYAFAKEVHKRHPRIPFYLQVGNADVTTLHAEHHALALLDKLKELAEKVVRDPDMQTAYVLPQLHVLLWSNATKR